MLIMSSIMRKNMRKKMIQRMKKERIDIKPLRWNWVCVGSNPTKGSFLVCAYWIVYCSGYLHEVELLDLLLQSFF